MLVLRTGSVNFAAALWIQIVHTQTAKADCNQTHVNTICVNTSCEFCWSIVPCLNSAVSWKFLSSCIHCRPPDNRSWLLIPSLLMCRVEKRNMISDDVSYTSSLNFRDSFCWLTAGILCLNCYHLMWPHPHAYIHILEGNQMMSSQKQSAVCFGCGWPRDLSLSLWLSFSHSSLTVANRPWLFLCLNLTWKTTYTYSSHTQSMVHQNPVLIPKRKRLSLITLWPISTCIHFWVVVLI